MMNNPSILWNVPRGTRAFTQVEVLISAGILAFRIPFLYTAFLLDFSSLKTTPEDLRTTHPLMQKVKSILLF